MKTRVLISLCAVSLLLPGCLQTVEQRMAADLQEVNSQFDAEAEYAAYVKKHGESARKLRESATAAATMRFRIHGGGGGFTKVDEYLPLTQDEVAAVREILTQIEETPARDFSSWLKIQHENHICPVSAPPPYWLELQFVSAAGEVLYYWGDYNAPIGDKAKAEAYRTSLSRPFYMLPAESLRRWKDQAFLKRVNARHNELLDSFNEPLAVQLREPKNLL